MFKTANSNAQKSTSSLEMHAHELIISSKKEQAKLHNTVAKQ